jgi:uncharacterized protein YbaP (TraB family)
MSMIGRGLALVVAIAIAGCSGGDTVPPSPDPAVVKALAREACAMVRGAFLFRIEKDGKTSWMLGTRHAGIALDQLPAHVGAAFAESTTAVFESHLDPPPGPTAPAISLEPALGAELWAKYQRIVGKQALARVSSVARGVIVLVTLYEDLELRLDRDLYRGAKARGMPIVVLEDDAETAAVAAELLGPETLRALVRAVRRRSDLEHSSRASLTAYCDGQLEPPGGFNPEETEKMAASLARRNDRWLTLLEPVLAAGGAFIVVGVAHLAQNNSVVDALRARGYTLTFEPSP